MLSECHTIVIFYNSNSLDLSSSSEDFANVMKSPTRAQAFVLYPRMCPALLPASVAIRRSLTIPSFKMKWEIARGVEDEMYSRRVEIDCVWLNLALRSCARGSLIDRIFVYNSNQNSTQAGSRGGDVDMSTKDTWMLLKFRRHFSQPSDVVQLKYRKSKKNSIYLEKSKFLSLSLRNSEKKTWMEGTTIIVQRTDFGCL